MQQLQIEYFFPLTEQIPLDLDYTKTHEYETEKRKKLFANSVTISTLSVTSSNGSFAPLELTLDAINLEKSTRLGNWEIENAKKKPGMLQKILMKNIFGMKWMGK
jgi:hypothetical protein